MLGKRRCRDIQFRGDFAGVRRLWMFEIPQLVCRLQDLPLAFCQPSAIQKDEVVPGSVGLASEEPPNVDRGVPIAKRRDDAPEVVHIDGVKDQVQHSLARAKIDDRAVVHLDGLARTPATAFAGEPVHPFRTVVEHLGEFDAGLRITPDFEHELLGDAFGVARDRAPGDAVRRGTEIDRRFDDRTGPVGVDAYLGPYSSHRRRLNRETPKAVSRAAIRRQGVGVYKPPLYCGSIYAMGRLIHSSTKMSAKLRSRDGLRASNDEESADSEAVLAALEDPDCRALLEATTDEALTAGELTERCDVARSTTYRKLEQLTEAGLLEEQIRISSSGKHASEFRRTFDDVTISLCDSEGVTVGLSKAAPTPEAAD